MRKRYTLPAIIGDSRLDTMLAVFSSIKDESDVEVSFSRFNEILPAGHAILACLVDTCCEKNCYIAVRDLDSAFRREIPVLKLLSSISEQGSLLPPTSFLVDQPNYSLRCFTGLPTSQWVLNYFERCAIKIEDDLQYFALLIMNELCQNAVDHSGAERYFAYIGIHRGELHFGVLDMGVSIPSKMRQKYIINDDLTAILYSLDKGIGTRRLRPGGLGLHYFFSIVQGNNGRLAIYSKNGFVRRYFKHKTIHKGKLKHELIGTWCFGRLPLC